MQPNLKKEARDKGRERGFYLGASEGASEAGEGGLGPSRSPGRPAPLFPGPGRLSCTPSRARPRTPITFSPWKLSPFPFSLGHRSFQAQRASGRDWRGPLPASPPRPLQRPAKGLVRPGPGRKPPPRPGDKGLAWRDACGQSPIATWAPHRRLSSPRAPEGRMTDKPPARRQLRAGVRGVH